MLNGLAPRRTTAARWLLAMTACADETTTVLPGKWPIGVCVMPLLRHHGAMNEINQGQRAARAPDPITEVNVKEVRGLYRITSSSSSTYFVDTRNPDRCLPSVLRARGAGKTMKQFTDNEWHTLELLQSGPRLMRDGTELPADEVDETDIARWTIRVGSRHKFDYRIPDDGENTDFWMVGRVCETITRLEQMPPEGEWTIAEREPRPGGG